MKFNTSDLVFNLTNGWGRVTDIRTTGTYLVFVSFDNHTENTYTLEGKYDGDDVHPTLFTKAEALQKFPEYPAPKRKVQIKRWLVTAFDGYSVYFTTKEGALIHFVEGENLLIELTGEYEV
jgi:hypothetical protein